MAAETNRRLLVPEDKIIVVLDTAPVRELAYVEEVPSWVDTFAKMKEDGYSFSLADATQAELLAQRWRNALSATDLENILVGLERFISPQLPVLLGKKDISGMLQINQEGWEPYECAQLSKRAFEWLKDSVHSTAQFASPEWALQEERDDWVGLFTGLQNIFDAIKDEDPHLPIDVNSLTAGMLAFMEIDQDAQSLLIPPLSVRNHLKNRYMWRQFVRKQKSSKAYDPNSPKKRNDGIDADLYRYLPLPALIVTDDNAFFGGLSDIDSFQRKWFFRAKQLADEWLLGNKPNPAWP